MRTAALFGTDLRVSRLGLGLFAIGGRGWGSDVDDRSSAAAIEAALDAGITLFDTAPIYGDGHADRLLARTLGARIRDVTVATKAGPRGEPPIADLSPENLRRDVEASLRRLGVERIDLLQLHWPCQRGTPLEATIEALEDLVEQSKIRHYGLCNYGPDELARACELGNVASLQTPISWVRREYEGALAKVAVAHRVGVLAYEPLARGMLTGKFRSLPRFGADDLRHRDPRFWAVGFAKLAPRVEQLRRAAEARGTAPAALAIAFAASRPGVVSALFGAKRPEQVKENVRAAELLG
ncbi:MAG: aldo/keto reductase [Sandaracinaceae bacterium]